MNDCNIEEEKTTNNMKRRNYGSRVSLKMLVIERHVKHIKN